LVVSDRSEMYIQKNLIATVLVCPKDNEKIGFNYLFDEVATFQPQGDFWQKLTWEKLEQLTLQVHAFDSIRIETKH